MSIVPSKSKKMKEDKPDYKPIIAKLREKHEPVFKALGIEDALFIPKMFYKPTGKDEKFIGLFASELRIGKDIYTEPVSRDYEQEDIKNPEIAKGTLFKWNYNAHWSTEYDSGASNTNSQPRFFIPVAELVQVVTEPSPFKDHPDEPMNEPVHNLDMIVEKPKRMYAAPEIVNDINKSPLDKPLSELTLREIINILNNLTKTK